MPTTALMRIIHVVVVDSSFILFVHLTPLARWAHVSTPTYNVITIRRSTTCHLRYKIKQFVQHKPSLHCHLQLLITTWKSSRCDFRIQMASSTLLAILLVAVATVQVALATNYYFTCDPPSPLEYGRISPPYRPKYYAGSKIKYSCNSGYRRHGPSWSVCRVQNKRAYWFPAPPVCKRKCGQISILSPVS